MDSEICIGDINMSNDVLFSLKTPQVFVTHVFDSLFFIFLNNMFHSLRFVAMAQNGHQCLLITFTFRIGSNFFSKVKTRQGGPYCICSQHKLRQLFAALEFAHFSSNF